ncbi:MAG: TonB-dependent receptor [Lysobacterales bacterium]|nr:MAG: TonB-dependent receptor [Xanthomonadales bacterium]
MKTRSSNIATAVRFALASAVGLSAALGAAASHAQTAGDQKLEEVYVTGSRIARGSDFESPSPVATFDRAALEKSGYTTLQQLLEKQPFAGNGTFSTRGNNQDSTANGAASISLRGLGADATLVLVNGRRVAISAFAEGITTNFVDINTIPVAAIERIEVLKDGASAVYGSDAVAGVVNIILRKDFDGYEVSAGYGAADSYDEQHVSGMWGIAGEDSNVTMIADYFTNDTLFNKDRGSLGSADQSRRGGEDFRSSRGFPGSFVVDGVATRDPACPPDRSAGANCVFDYGPYNLLIPEAERTGFMLLARNGVGNGMELFAEVGFQHNNSIAQGAPTPLDGEAGLTVPADHPGNPFATTNTIEIRRFRTVDAGARQWDISTDNLRGLLGLRGEWNDWDWEVAAQRARSESDQTGSRRQGWVRTDYLQQQIDAGRYNPFGGTFNSADVIDDITTSLVRRGKSDLTAFDGSISGEIYELPAGNIGLAAGLEYRDESISDVPDEQFQRGLIFGTESIAARAERDITSAYVEVSVPIIESLDADFAVRYDDYSDFGDTFNPKIAVRWAPLDSLAARASWGTGFRAPSLAQIGLGPSDESQFFTDTFGCNDNPIYCAATDYTIRFSGNPDLQPETSDSWNIGVQWQPLADLRFSVDYWDITQDDKIDEVPFGLIYQANCNEQGNPLCERGAPLPGDTLGPLIRVYSTFGNIGEQSVNGIDFGAYWTTDLVGGVLSLSLDYSRLLEFTRDEVDGDGNLVSRELTGEYEYPEDRFVLSGDWAFTDWGASAVVNYVGSFEDTPDIDFDGILDFDQNRSRTVGSFTTVNLQGRYTGFEGITLVLGLDNALDEDPPFAIGDGDTDLYGYVSSQHDPRGQFIYGKVTFRF